MNPKHTTQGEDETIRRALRNTNDPDVSRMEDIIIRLDSEIEQQRKCIAELESHIERITE